MLLSVNRQPDSNTVQVADEVHQEMAAIRPTLPAGVDMRPFYDQSNIVNESIASVRDAIIIGLLLVGPDHLAVSARLGHRRHDRPGRAGHDGRHVHRDEDPRPEFNLMTLGGLAAAVGLVIDDKIVVVENIVLHRDGGEGPLQATASALKELTVPLIGSTLTPIVVFLPLITITGVTGTFFSALAIAMSVVAADVAGARAGLDQQPEHAPDSARQKATTATHHTTPRPSGVRRRSERAQMRRMMAAEEASLAAECSARARVLRARCAAR